MKHIAIIVVAAATLVACDNSPEAQAKAHDRDKISLCWSDQGKKSLDPGTARTVAGWCEKMEDDFKAKYGRAP